MLVLLVPHHGGARNRLGALGRNDGRNALDCDVAPVGGAPSKRDANVETVPAIAAVIFHENSWSQRNVAHG